MDNLTGIDIARLCDFCEASNDDIELESSDGLDIASDKEIIENVMLNVGGKKFYVAKLFLQKLLVNVDKLFKYPNDNRDTEYFLDRDPQYFTRITNKIKETRTAIFDKVDEYSEQMCSELCFYGLIDPVHYPTARIKLQKTVKFNQENNKIVKITIHKYIFHVLYNTIAHSPKLVELFSAKGETKEIILDTDPKMFRNLINFLRAGELYLGGHAFASYLDSFQINYVRTDNKKMSDDIIVPQKNHSYKNVNRQLIDCINIVDPRQPDAYPYKINKYYYPKSISISPNIENINSIYPLSDPVLGEILQFDLLAGQSPVTCIDSVNLVIMMPVLDPIKAEYADLLQYKIIEKITLEIDGKVVLYTDSHILHDYYYIYHHNGAQYHTLTNLSMSKSKLLLNEEYQQVHRIFLPLGLLTGKSNHIPVGKLLNAKKSCKLNIQLASASSILKRGNIDIKPLSANLSVNNIHLAPEIVVNQKGKYISQPVNVKLLKTPMLYIYSKFHSMTINIQPSTKNYDAVIIPLDRFKFIKDFYFTIISKSDYIAGRIGIHQDVLIDMEIINTIGAPGGTDSHNTTVDAFMMNSVVPLNKLGHVLPPGVYYHTFSADPLRDEILGGLVSKGYIVNLKIKKIDGYVRFHAREYLREVL
jgi:hypothetical protein